MARRRRRTSREVDDLVARAIRSAPDGLTAYGLMARLEKRQQPIAPTQTYRALRRLIERGVVRRIESLNAYVGTAPGMGHDAVSLFCRSCRRSLPVEAAGPVALLPTAAAEHGFRSVRIIVEIAGTCPDCSGQGGG